MPNLFSGFPVSRAKVAEIITGEAAPKNHKTDHQLGGDDELDVTGLVGAGGGGIAANSLYLPLHGGNTSHFIDTLTGSGSITRDNRRVMLNTGTTPNSTVLTWLRTEASSFAITFAKNCEYVFFAVFTNPFNYSYKAYLSYGIPEISNHISFKLINSKLQGAVGNGSIETTVDLETFSGGGSSLARKLYFTKNATNNVDFYVDDVLKGSISTNLPNTVSNAERLFHIFEDNLGLSTSIYLRIAYISSLIKT